MRGHGGPGSNHILAQRGNSGIIIIIIIVIIVIVIIVIMIITITIWARDDDCVNFGSQELQT